MDKEIIENLRQQNPLDIRLEGSYCDPHRAAIIASNVKLIHFEVLLVQEVIGKCGGHDKYFEYIQNNKLGCYSCLLSENELTEIMAKAVNLEAMAIMYKGNCTVGNISMFTNITEDEELD